MQRYINNVTDRQGTAVTGASVSVYDSNGDLATLYSDDGVTTQSNPLNTDSDGMYSFYAANGVYSITVSKTGFGSKTTSGILLEDVVGGTRQVFLTDFPGADPTGATNSSAAMNLAIAAASAIGSCDVVVAPGLWLLDPFTVPTGVNIVGAVQGPFDGGASPASSTSAPTILVNSGSGAFITLNGYKSSVHNLLFYYPNQVAPTASTPTVCDPTVYVPAGQGGGHVIKGCTFVNSYEAIKIGVGRCIVQDCIIGAFYRDIIVDEAQDWVIVSNVLCQVMWDVYAGLSFPQTIDAWVLSNGIALDVGRVDSLCGTNFNVFGRYAGFSARDSENTGLSTRNGYGRLTNVDFDYVAYGVISSSTNSTGKGFKIVNMDVAANMSGVGTAGQATVILNSGGTSSPTITWSGGSARGTWAGGSNLPVVNAGNAYVNDVRGINDGGLMTAPSVAASGADQVNPFSIPVRIGLSTSGGSMSAININGNATGQTGSQSFIQLMPGETLNVTYTGTLSWAWFAS